MHSPRLVIVVCVDSLNLNMVGCYGNEWVATPHLDRLAYEGLVFDRYFANRPERGATLATAMTGESGWFRRPPPALLAELSRQGVVTAWFRDAPPKAHDAEFAAAFTKAVNCAPPSDPEGLWASAEEVARHPEFGPRRCRPGTEAVWMSRWRQLVGREQRLGDAAERSIDRLFAMAADWLGSQGDTRCLLWIEVALQAGLWLPPTAFRERYATEDEAPGLADPQPGEVGVEWPADDLGRLRRGYAARVSYFDKCLGDFLARLHPLLDDALLALVADEGTPLGEHGRVGSFAPSLYEERVHVPLILRGPWGRVGERTAALAQTLDWHATLGELYALPAPAIAWGQAWQPRWQGEPPPPRRWISVGLEDSEYAILSNHWKLILPLPHAAAIDLDTGTLSWKPRLYAKPEDRWDVNDVARQYPAACDFLELQLRRWIEADRRALPEMWRDLEPSDVEPTR